MANLNKMAGNVRHLCLWRTLKPTSLALLHNKSTKPEVENQLLIRNPSARTVADSSTQLMRRNLSADITQMHCYMAPENIKEKRKQP